MLDAYQESLLIFCGINLIAAFSFYLPFKTGQVSLGQAGFMGVGAYAAGIITTKLGLTFRSAGDQRGGCGHCRHHGRISGTQDQGYLSPAADARLRADRSGGGAHLGLYGRP